MGTLRVVLQYFFPSDGPLFAHPSFRLPAPIARHRQVPETAKKWTRNFLTQLNGKRETGKKTKEKDFFRSLFRNFEDDPRKFLIPIKYRNCNFFSVS